MLKPGFTSLAVASLLWLSAALTYAQDTPATNFFQITSGRYGTCCGIAGPRVYVLPDAQQSFVTLVLSEDQLSARMAILGEDMLTVLHRFENGRVTGDRIEFGMPGPPPPPGGDKTWMHYIVSNTAAGLRFNGAIVEPTTGADIINHFTHTNVVAILLAPPPVTTIRVSEVEVCWTSAVNRRYQVQYRSSLTGNEWVNLGEPIPGNEAKTCINDKIEPGQPRRFYRVVNIP